MQFTGKVDGLVQDYATGTFTISFTVNEHSAVTSGFDSIKSLEKLDVKAVKHREKRSLDANAYAWVLMSKIADTLGASKEEVYEEMLSRYGVLYEDESGYITITVSNKVDINKVDGHWKLIRQSDKFKAYAMIKGSSQYDTKEMSHFIDGIVSEAKDLGIETLTPMELEQMKVRWANE